MEFCVLASIFPSCGDVKVSGLTRKIAFPLNATDQHDVYGFTVIWTHQKSRVPFLMDRARRPTRKVQR